MRNSRPSDQLPVGHRAARRRATLVRRAWIIGSSVGVAALIAAGGGILALHSFGAMGAGPAIASMPTRSEHPASASAAAAAAVASGKDGKLITVQIPGTVSHFKARPALVWEPPAAMAAHPRALPVAILLSGQSGTASPEDVRTGGHIEQTMDAIAAANHGVAPIVVVPDQLEVGTNNPMCVDGPLGNSRTYLTVDVIRWIRAHFSVETNPADWVIGGFSQGGTCAIQLGAGDPQQFGNLIDDSGELAPTLGSDAKTIRDGFSGNVAAWRAAQPLNELRAHTPYADSAAFFAAGQLDKEYGPVMPILAEAARRAGMHVTTLVVPNGRHNWYTGGIGIGDGMVWFEHRLGL